MLHRATAATASITQANSRSPTFLIILTIARLLFLIPMALATMPAYSARHMPSGLPVNLKVFHREGIETERIRTRRTVRIAKGSMSERLKLSVHWDTRHRSIRGQRTTGQSSLPVADGTRFDVWLTAHSWTHGPCGEAFVSEFFRCVRGMMQTRKKSAPPRDDGGRANVFGKGCCQRADFADLPAERY